MRVYCLMVKSKFMVKTQLSYMSVFYLYQLDLRNDVPLVLPVPSSSSTRMRVDRNEPMPHSLSARNGQILHLRLLMTPF